MVVRSRISQRPRSMSLTRRVTASRSRSPLPYRSIPRTQYTPLRLPSTPWTSAEVRTTGSRLRLWAQVISGSRARGLPSNLPHESAVRRFVEPDQERATLPNGRGPEIAGRAQEDRRDLVPTRPRPPEIKLDHGASLGGDDPIDAVEEGEGVAFRLGLFLGVDAGRDSDTALGKEPLRASTADSAGPKVCEVDSRQSGIGHRE